MLKIIKTTLGNRGETTKIQLSGTIDETTNFEVLFGQVSQELHVVCRHVTRINSCGIRSWVRYFTKIRNVGTKVVLQECSPALVEIMSLFFNFAFGISVQSVSMPFECVRCKRNYVALLSQANLNTFATQGETLSTQCPHCRGQAKFNGGVELNYIRPILQSQNP